MKRFSNVLRLALYVTVLTAALNVPASRAAGPPSGLDVNVVNTMPVPVQGNMTVGGSVGITGTANVNVTNTVPTQNAGGGAATQVGQPASKLVSLLCNSKGCFQIARDGKAGGSLFSVPAGEALVITDVQWINESLRTPGSYAFTELDVNGAGVAIFSALVDATGVWAGQAHLATGAVITSGNTVSVAWLSANLPPGGAEPFAYLQGYLAPNQ
jgi:hypothetical protein